MSPRVTFLASTSFKFFVGFDRQNFFLYREKNILWHKKLPSPDSVVCGVGDNGLVLVRSTEGFFPFHASGEDPLFAIEKYRTGNPAMHGISIGKVLVEGTGNGFLVEKITEKTKGGGLVFEVARYDMAAGSEQSVWKSASDKKTTRFQWAATRDLGFMVIAEERPKPFPQKGLASKMFLLEPRSGKTLYEVSLSDMNIAELHVSDLGTVAARLEAQGEIRYLGVRPDGEKFFVTPPNKNVQLVHVGSKILLLEEPATRVWHFKTFEDKLLFSIELKTLDEIKAGFCLLLKSNDDPVLVSPDKDGRTLRLVYTALQDLQIQCKSLRLEAEQAESPHEEKNESRKPRETAGIKFIPIEETEMKTNEKRPPVGGDKNRIEDLLGKLEERFIKGEISEKAYYELKEKYELKLKDLG